MMQSKELTIKYKIWLETDEKEGVLGYGKWRLLKTIHQTGSLKEAMKIHGLSYRKTWNNLNKIEETLGFQIIERKRGGKEGGKTTLTSQGKAIVNAFDKFYDKYDKLISEALLEVLNEINQKI